MDWAGNPDDGTSISALLIFLDANPISWSSTKQWTIACSSTEVENCAIATVVAELQQVKMLLSKLLTLLQLPPTLFLDNLSATYLSTNRVFHSRMKHLAIDYHFDGDLVQWSERRVVHFSAGDQLVDALIESLSRPHLFYLYNKISVIFGTPS